MTPSVVATIVVIMFFATALQSSVGFGSNLIAMPTIVQLAPDLVPGSVLMSTFIVSIFVLIRDRQSLDISPVRNALFGRLAGTGIGVVALTMLTERGIGFVIGFGVLAMVLVSARGLELERTPIAMLTAGTISGFSASTAGIGGPPVALMYQRSEGPEIRSSMAAFFLIGSLMTFSGLAYAGRFGWDEIRWGISLAPASLAGFFASRWIIPLVDRGLARPLVLSVSAASALLLIIRLVFFA